MIPGVQTAQSFSEVGVGTDCSVQSPSRGDREHIECALLSKVAAWGCVKKERVRGRMSGRHFCLHVILLMSTLSGASDVIVFSFCVDLCIVSYCALWLGSNMELSEHAFFALRPWSFFDDRVSGALVEKSAL